MQNIIKFIQANMNFLNDIQAYHWQTKSYSEHESFGEYYTSFNKLNDRLVETWHGKSDDNKRIIFTSKEKSK